MVTNTAKLRRPDPKPEKLRRNPGEGTGVVSAGTAGWGRKEGKQFKNRLLQPLLQLYLREDRVAVH